MKPNKAPQDNEILVQHILQLAEDIYRAIKPTVPPEWLNSDLTVAQLRVLLILYTEGANRMSAIASSIGIALSTATGIVDNLVKKGLVFRGADPEDRRLVICSLSPEGQATVNRMWTLGQFQIEKLLHGLPLEELKKADEVAEILLNNVISNVSSTSGVVEKQGRR